MEDLCERIDLYRLSKKQQAGGLWQVEGCKEGLALLYEEYLCISVVRVRIHRMSCRSHARIEDFENRIIPRNTFAFIRTFQWSNTQNDGTKAALFERCLQRSPLKRPFALFDRRTELAEK